MSRDPASSGNEPLQFDVAESGTTDSTTNAGATTCKACSRPIAGEYYQVNGAIVCAPCRASLDRVQGTRLERVLRAAGLGILAAAGGSLLYFTVAAITGREFGLVAIVVGYMVGIAVRKGSRGRGGWAYQTLAVGLTYLAIVTSYVPLVAKEFQKRVMQRDSVQTTATRRDLAPTSTPPMADTITISARGPDVGRAIDSAAAAKRADTAFAVTQAGTPAALPRGNRVRPTHLGPATVLLGIAALVLIAAAVPILAGFSNIIGLLIIGIAVFEAWKLNRRVVLEITGPYRLATGTTGSAGGSAGAVG